MEVFASHEADRRVAIIDAEIRRLSKIWNADTAIWLTPDKQLLDGHSLALKRGFGMMINHPMNGAGCFSVSPAYWQALLANHFLWHELSEMPREFETGEALAHVQHLVRPGLEAISRDVVGIMQQAFPEFLTPWHTVHAYLKWLKVHHFMFDKRVLGKRWVPSGSAVHRRKEQEAKWHHERERKDDLAEWLDLILSSIPAGESSNFDRSTWIDQFIFAYDEHEARGKLEEIYEMVVAGSRLAEDMLDLPLAAEFRRQESAQSQRRIEAQRKRLADLEQSQRKGRIAILCRSAEQALDSYAQVWLDARHDRLGGMTPRSASGASGKGLAEANVVLQQLVQERQKAAALEAAEVRQNAALEKNRTELMDAAKMRARDPVRASLWCKTSNPKIGGHRPFDYCIDDFKLRVCKDIMPENL